jgi:hypothetical protein
MPLCFIYGVDVEYLDFGTNVDEMSQWAQKQRLTRGCGDDLI